MIDDGAGSAARTGAPIRIGIRLQRRQLKLAREGKFHLEERPGGQGDSRAIPVQFERPGGAGEEGFLCWRMPPGKKGRRVFVLVWGQPAAPEVMVARKDEESGQFVIAESGKPILRYVYKTLEPGELLAAVRPGSRKYARARSNYIHPLHGPDGEILTKDWAEDHPHHRGVYWAWPETIYRGEVGDLHALQRVFARPTGKIRLTQGSVYAQIEAENQWLWEDREPIVHESATIRAHASGRRGRCIDLKFVFTALQDGVTIARRGTDKYGGLNIRLSTTTRQELVLHNDPVQQIPRRGWADFVATFGERSDPTGILVLQRQSNPNYPGDWIKYPEIQWFQPTFPAAGSRHALKKGSPLVLQYRLWIRRGEVASEECYVDQWRAYQQFGGL